MAFKHSNIELTDYGDFDSEDLETILEDSGKKEVFLVLFAFWCPPCKKILRRMYDDAPNKKDVLYVFISDLVVGQNERRELVYATPEEAKGLIGPKLEIQGFDYDTKPENVLFFSTTTDSMRAFSFTHYPTCVKYEDVTKNYECKDFYWEDYPF